MALKIINTLLILFALYMGIKQGWSMISGKPEMMEMFGKWNIGKTGLMVLVHSYHLWRYSSPDAQNIFVGEFYYGRGNTFYYLPAFAGS